MSERYSGRLGLQQRVLPNYRVAFFDLLAAACGDGLSVFAGLPRPQEGIVGGAPRVAQQTRARNLHLLGGSAYLCFQAGLLAWLQEWDPQALIVEANPRYLSTRAAVRWMHARARPVIGWGLGAPPIQGVLGAVRLARRTAFLDQFDSMIAYSQRGADEYSRAGVPRDRVFVAANSVSARPVRKPERGPIGDIPTILFVGRLQPRKQVDALLRACAELPAPRPHLIIVGDGPERARLEALAQQTYPAAEFVGARRGSELDPYFARADLFVLPGTGGLAVQEAMTHALPIIVARGDGTQDDLVRAGNGWQIPADDYRALVGAMRNALADTDRLRRMGEESFRIVSEEVNLEAMVEAFVGALNRLGDGSAPGPRDRSPTGGRL
jgi:glycosyltransferase involved in cell wall biosynthesis